MPNKIDYKTTSALLTAGEPMDFKAFPDGSLVVIAHDGKKHRFTADQVAEVQPKPSEKPAPNSTRSRPSKPSTKIAKGG